MQLCEFIKNNCFINGFGMSMKLRNGVSYILFVTKCDGEYEVHPKFP